MPEIDETLTILRKTSTPSSRSCLAGSRRCGAAQALIERCREACRERGASKLTWQTAKDNARAQAVYDRIGGKREEWLDYSLEA